MKAHAKRLPAIVRTGRGASLVEYGLVLGLVGLVGFPIVERLGDEISNLFGRSADAVSYASITVDDSLDPDAFVFEVSTATGAIFPSSGGTIQIDWGDETANASCTTTYVIDPNTPLTCDYPEAGIYQIAITGDMTGYGQLYSAAYKADITRMIQWGNTGLTDLSNAFYGATNITTVPDQIPSSVSSINRIFAYARAINDPVISKWDTSNIANFDFSFANADSFNVDISNWNLSSAVSLTGTFRQALSFNRDISNWDVSSVQSMDYLFRGASSFNQDLSTWDTSKVETMHRTFAQSDFNGDISGWDTGSVVNMQSMFSENPAFNRDISNWDVSSVRRFDRMFLGSSSFSHDLSNWDTSSSDSFQQMFEEAHAFNSDISAWDVSNATNFYRMFFNGNSFNSDISSWNVTARL